MTPSTARTSGTLARSVTTRGPGRPIDPEIESRVFAKVLEVYGETGWAGFTIHAVATRAKVGKAAIYRRWATKEDLIVDAIVSLGDHSAVIDSGSLRGDLIAIARGLLHEYLSPVGVVRLRAQVEAKVYPEVFGAAMERWRKQRLDIGRVILHRAVDRGELAPEADLALLLDAIGGMTINHFIATPTSRLAALRRNSNRFAEAVADFALAAVAHKTADI